MSQEDYMRRKNMSVDNLIRDIVFSTTFATIGNVSKVYDKGLRIDVTLPVSSVNKEPIVLSGIEVVTIGSNKVRVHYTPEIGDAVLVFSTDTYYPEIEYAHKTNSFDTVPYFTPYSMVTMKALILQTSGNDDKALFIDIKDNEVTIDVPDSISNVKIKAKKIDINNGHLTVT